VSDEPITPPADETPTEPMPQAPAEQPAVQTATAPEPTPAVVAEKPARSFSAVHIAAIVAALVIAFGLSAVSFGTGVFVGRMGGGDERVMVGGRGALSGQCPVPGAADGFDNGRESRQGDAGTRYRRGPGRMGRGAPFGQ